MKIGLEIHQQLNTGKLFCRCDSKIIKRPPDKVIKRQLKAISGELGKVDIAASYEQKKEREIFYEFYNNDNCLVELDEEPPQPINKDALEIAIKIAFLLNMEPLEEIQVMRKSVVDGSNTSGFQRTALVGINGYVETKEGKVRVNRLYLEEDSARRISGEKTIFRLDRLGIPLVEIRTEPDIKSPEHAYQIARKIGQLLRVTDVRRGIGTIRQDVNVSVRGGKKVEIKGFQDIKSIKKTIEMEANRQKGFLQISKELKKRKAKSGQIREITDIIEKTKSNLKKSFGTSNALKLNGFQGLLKKPAGFSWLGKELSQIAKNFGFGGIIHSDELPAFGITNKEIEKIRERVGCKKNDAFLFIVSKKDNIPALKTIAKRADMFVNGAPSEVRVAKGDGTTGFLRPMPGSARMYPETDLLLIKVDSKRVKILKKDLPERPETTKERYLVLGLGSEQTEQIIRSGHSKLFDKLISESKLKPSVIASLLLSSPNEYKKNYGVKIEIDEKWLIPVISLLEKGMISKNMIPQIINDLSKGKKLEKITSSFVSEDRIEYSIKKVLKKNKDVDNRKLVGLVLADLKGRASPSKIFEIIKKII